MRSGNRARGVHRRRAARAPGRRVARRGAGHRRRLQRPSPSDADAVRARAARASSPATSSWPPTPTCSRRVDGAGPPPPMSTATPAVSASAGCSFPATAPTTPARRSSTSPPAHGSCTPGCTSRRRCRRRSGRCASASTARLPGSPTPRSVRRRRRSRKLAEGSAAAGRSGPAMRQAVWDVTEFVAAAGTGTYTVADIVHERAGAFMPYASWAIVAAYELDPAADLAVVAPTPEAQQRFARRAVSWHDGFVARADAPVEVPVNGLAVDAGRPGVRQELPRRRPCPAPRRREPAVRRQADRQQRDAGRRWPRRRA